MVNISKEELYNLEQIDSGNFGTIYKKGDKVYKVYNKTVKTSIHESVKNPMLKHKLISINKLNRLIKLRDNIKNTDLIEDLLYIDNKFNGVIMPYYDGKLFYNIMDYPIEERIELSKQLVKNAKELTDNKIYPLDYKLINVFFANNEVKIIDLDDIFTKVYKANNNYYKHESIVILDETIKTFLNEHKHGQSAKVIEALDKKPNKANSSYEKINQYLFLKSIKQNLIFIDENYNQEYIPEYKTIFTYKQGDEDYIINSINKLKQRGISVNDIVRYEYIDEYIDNTPHNNCFLSENNNTLKLKK